MHTTSRQILHRKLNIHHISWSSLGSFVAIGWIAYVSSITGYTFLIPPFGATCYIVFSIPDSAFAQPRNIIGGHVLAVLVGLLCLFIFGSNWWSQAIAISSIVAGMHLIRVNHPLAAATTMFLTLQEHSDWKVLFTVLIGSIMVAAVAVVFNKYVLKHKYPHYWW
jgi:CBS-domain-containing membrane protein